MPFFLCILKNSVQVGDRKQCSSATLTYLNTVNFQYIVTDDTKRKVEGMWNEWVGINIQLVEQRETDKNLVGSPTDRLYVI
jgi:hypothetical protein